MVRISTFIIFLIICIPVLSDDDLPTQLTPDQERLAISEAERLGRIIYRHNRAAWIATDAALKLRKFRKERRTVGWITEDRGGEIVVTFIGDVRDNDISALYRVTVMDDETLKAPVHAYQDPEPLSDFELAAAYARAAAVSSEFHSCSKAYNSVVLPPEGDQGELWTVYLLPGTTKQNVVPVGGSHRFYVDSESQTIDSQRKYTHTCIQLQKDPRAAALMLTHLLDVVPTEIHVFWNLYADMPIYLATPPQGTIWALEKGRIKLVERSTSGR